MRSNPSITICLLKFFYNRPAGREAPGSAKPLHQSSPKMSFSILFPSKCELFRQGKNIFVQIKKNFVQADGPGISFYDKEQLMLNSTTAFMLIKAIQHETCGLEGHLVKLNADFLTSPISNSAAGNYYLHRYLLPYPVQVFFFVCEFKITVLSQRLFTSQILSIKIGAMVQIFCKN